MGQSISRLIFLVLAGAPMVSGQTFEAASVRPYDTASPAHFFTMQGGPGTSDPNRFACRKCSLLNLLMTAFDVKGYQVSFAVRTDRYDVEANVPEGTSRAQFLLMLQNLLIDRFRLTLHHEMREMTTYRLVAGKNGPKLTRSPVTGPFASDSAAHETPHPSDADGFPDLPPGSGITIYADVQNTYRLGAKNVSMQRLAATLSSTLSRPVSDGTGLEGEYDFKLLWAPDLAGAARHQDGSVVQSDPDAESRPTLQQAVQAQLGLSLEPSRGQVDVLAIDHAEKAPIGN
jgi:uncharacterized protein (TIGR03435 family)